MKVWAEWGLYTVVISFYYIFREKIKEINTEYPLNIEHHHWLEPLGENNHGEYETQVVI